MKKDKFYTVNKYNQPLFAKGVDRIHHNIFDGLPGASNILNYSVNTPVIAPRVNWSDPIQRAAALGTTKGISEGFMQDFINNSVFEAATKGNTGISGLKNFYNKNKQGLLSLAGSTIGGLGSGLISGGLSTGAGSAVGSIGGAVGGIVGAANPLLGAAITAGSGIIGGFINRAFGSKLNEENIAQVNQKNAELNQNAKALSGASTNSDLLSNWGNVDLAFNFDKDFIGEDGWFSSKAENKFNELKAQQEAAKQKAIHGLSHGAFNIETATDNNTMANFINAYGGPIDTMNTDTEDMGAIDYDFMDRYLAAKEDANNRKNKMSDGGDIYIKPENRGKFTALKERTGHSASWFKEHGTPAQRKMATFALNAKKWKHSDGGPLNVLALGGDYQTNGADFNTGLTHIDAGKSHEENPYEGVQMGVDPEGVPNLVEEGEVVFNDYVYSNRIELDDEAKAKFHFSKKMDITYAEAAKKLEKEISERPNDPISQAGFKVQMEQLAEQQERQKKEMEAQKAQEAFDALSPEEQVAVMQNLEQQEAMAQEAAMQEQAAQEQAMAEQQGMQQPSPEEMAMMEQQMNQQESIPADNMNACGGKINKFDKGGKKNAGTWKTGDSSSNWSAYTKNGLRDYLLSINDEIAQAETEEDKKKIREKAIKTVNNIQQAYADAYQENLTPSERSEKVKALQKAFQEAGGNAYFSNIANNINVPKGHNTGDTEEKGWIDGYWGPRTSIRNWGSTEYGDTDYYKDIADLATEAGLTYAPGDIKYGDNTLYQLGLASPESITVSPEPKEKFEADPYTDGWEERRGISTEPITSDKEDTDKNPKPRHRYEGLRYAGLFGPAVGLGMQMAGIGRPDTSGLDAAVNSAQGVHLADYKPLGNYLTYRPMDIWYEQNRMDANARATDRAIANTNNPSKMAGLVANGYNTLLADGDLYRKALEYNDAKRAQVAEFNRGTDKFNADAYNRVSQFNAEAQNRAKQYNAQLAMQAAREKMDADAGWYNSIYGNVAGLFKGFSDLGRENALLNSASASAADGVYGNLGDSNTGKRYIKAAKGGKLKKKKGLTF